MAEQVEMLAHKTDDPNPVPRDHIKAEGRTNSPELSSDLYKSVSWVRVPHSHHTHINC